jgi:hypothetical protein
MFSYVFVSRNLVTPLVMGFLNTPQFLGEWRCSVGFAGQLCRIADGAGIRINGVFFEG